VGLLLDLSKKEGDMTDASASSVIFHNNGGFDCNFSVQWDGGQTGRTEVLMRGQTATMDLTRYDNIPEGQSCWARCYVFGGVNHDSGRNFNFHRIAGSVEYTITGGTLNPSFD
jgi:hypothetical protein